ncbi:MAG: DNA-binding protein [Thermodesulfovibrio sp.]|nr:DNA-binding protein [Thermodesulfovibrio sp.]
MSPRLKKPRHCGCQLKKKAYKPAGISMKDLEKIVLYKDELETLKLCDMDGLTQAQAGSSMGISRGTVQRILSSARKKVATALSGCKALVMEEIICKEEKS